MHKHAIQIVKARDSFVLFLFSLKIFVLLVEDEFADEISSRSQLSNLHLHMLFHVLMTH